MKIGVTIASVERNWNLLNNAQSADGSAFTELDCQKYFSIGLDTGLASLVFDKWKNIPSLFKLDLFVVPRYLCRRILLFHVQLKIIDPLIGGDTQIKIKFVEFVHGWPYLFYFLITPQWESTK